MNKSRSNEVEETLQKPQVHEKWEMMYRTPESEAFFEMAFDAIVRELAAPDGSITLDAGCGRCGNSMQMAKRGFHVVAVDFSAPVLAAAQENLNIAGLGNLIKLEQQNILSLTYPNASFDNVLCWGVLMHIPEIEKAISELDRVLKPGGCMVLAENNMHSVQALLRRSLRMLSREESTEMIRTEAGLEWWTQTGSGKLLTRYADIGWLKNDFKKRGYSMISHRAGQFSELYSKTSSHGIQRSLHRFNSTWFRSIKNPNLAFGNLLMMKKNIPS